MEEFFPEDSKEQISEQMATLIDSTDTFVDDNTVVVNGQKWRKNPNYDPKWWCRIILMKLVSLLRMNNGNKLMVDWVVVIMS